MLVILYLPAVFNADDTRLQETLIQLLKTFVPTGEEGKRMNDSPYRVGTADGVNAAPLSRSTALMFWLGIGLLFAALAGTTCAIYRMTTLGGKISGPVPTINTPAEIVARLSSYSLIATVSAICLLPALLIVVIAYRRQSRAI